MPDFVDSTVKHDWGLLHIAAMKGDAAMYLRLSAKHNAHQEARVPLADFHLMLAMKKIQTDNTNLKIDEHDQVCITPAALPKYLT